jgi:hypothetical protein
VAIKAAIEGVISDVAFELVQREGADLACETFEETRYATLEGQAVTRHTRSIVGAHVRWLPRPRPGPKARLLISQLFRLLSL